ncbi:ABC transporter substrate-binding protein [Streptosporangium lutulentum]|uniref:Branched-chain amino acid transport system substrate-binding protein n=1 Tax=Streptosporangium lutulentum TaxID=1461250 RepID=A0ABT9QJY4_9ACTN|nr:ABC transporter substrate-binding protein [Streptosporangium lutulentum]MDP9847019.1 branched-chain amino acid transport system substrate-binding protein [Streptosporangium lutulentum]
MKVRSAVVAGVLGAVLATSLTACGSSSASDADSAGGSGSGGDIQLGAVYSLTGPTSVLGLQDSEGAKAAVKYLNDNGGLLGKQINLTVLDDKSQPSLAVQLVGQLTSRNHVSAIVGPDEQTAVTAAVPAAARAQVPIMTNGGSWPGPLKADQQKWGWAATTPTTVMIDQFIDYFKATGVKKVAILGNGTSFSDALPAYLATKTDLPFTVVVNSKFTSGAVDVSPQVLQAVNAKPDFVMSWMSGPDAVNVVKTFKRLNVDVPLGMNGGTTTPSFVDAAGKDALTGVIAGTYSAQLYDSLPADTANKTQVKAYLDGMAAAGLDAAGGASNAIMGWESVMSLADAIKTAGSADSEKINTALAGQHFVGAMSVWTRTADDHAGAEGGYLLAKFDGNEWKGLSNPES